MPMQMGYRGVSARVKSSGRVLACVGFCEGCSLPPLSSCPLLSLIGFSSYSLGRVMELENAVVGSDLSWIGWPWPSRPMAESWSALLLALLLPED